MATSPPCFTRSSRTIETLARQPQLWSKPVQEVSTWATGEEELQRAAQRERREEPDEGEPQDDLAFCCSRRGREQDHMAGIGIGTPIAFTSMTHAAASPYESRTPINASIDTRGSVR